MRFSLLPKEEKFFDYFREQGEIIQKTAEILRDIFVDYKELDEKVKRIQELEHQGDKIVREVALRLNKIFITPIDREDIHQLTSALDDVTDYINGAAVRLVLFKVESSTLPAIQLAETLVEAARHIALALQNLADSKDVTPHTDKVKELERIGDEINRPAIAQLFHDDLPVLEVIKLKEIYERLETALDICEDVAQIIEAIMLKHA